MRSRISPAVWEALATGGVSLADSVAVAFCLGADLARRGMVCVYMIEDPVCQCWVQGSILSHRLVICVSVSERNVLPRSKPLEGSVTNKRCLAINRG